MNEWEFNVLEDRPTLLSVSIRGIDVHPGDRVRLRPRAGGDVFDLALAGKIATVESIEQDYEGKTHVCVVLDDDPGRDIGLMRQPGHRFFFDASEVDPLGAADRPSDPAVATTSILIAGIGNIFLGDDAFGVEVASRLANREMPPGVRVADFGIRGLDLTYALIDGADVTILVDACPRGGAPGDLYVVQPDLSSPPAEAAPPMVDAHAMNPMNVIRAAQALRGTLKTKILLLGCEPLTMGPDEGQMGLSEPVTEAVERAVPLLESLIKRLSAGEWPLQTES